MTELESKIVDVIQWMYPNADDNTHLTQARFLQSLANAKNIDIIFVFGSNEAGVHGAGAARSALEKWGAVWGSGVGRNGNSYAIPTKDHNIQTLPVESIKPYVDDFIDYVKDNPGIYLISEIGCGLAGYTSEEIAPLFQRLYDETIYHPTNFEGKPQWSEAWHEILCIKD